MKFNRQSRPPERLYRIVFVDGLRGAVSRILHDFGAPGSNSSMLHTAHPQNRKGGCCSVHWQRMGSRSTAVLAPGKRASRDGEQKPPSRNNRTPRTGIARPSRAHKQGRPGLFFSLLTALVGVALVFFVFEIHSRYTFSLQSPLRIHFRWPLVIAQRQHTSDALGAEFDQHGQPLTAYQQYACREFGPACRTALAIQRTENPQGKCEIYHYNSDGTLDWGYFQINTVHLKRPGLNLRDLLDCKANIDFAYQLYKEKQGFTAWSTYNNGTYRRYLRE